MSKTLARLAVLAKAAPTYLLIAATVVTVGSQYLADALPGDTATTVTKVAGVLLGIIGAATTIVRRVTPVLPAQRGLLEPPSKEG